MKTARQKWLLRIYGKIYSGLNKLLIFNISPQRAHRLLIAALRLLDRVPLAIHLAESMHRVAWQVNPTEVGGIRLSHPLILAAGLVKGDGFADENTALSASAESRRNIMPGWRFVPALVGPVEFGSFTRYPRLGNTGTVLWRHEASRSTQNRVGLKNPGARAAADFLASRKHKLPYEYGINIAVSPGVSEIDQQEREVIQSLDFFLNAGVIPSWFTLNLSCPNTEDDPLGHQLDAETRQLCGTFIKRLAALDVEIPLWVKISPQLAQQQYQVLMRIFAEVGVRAVIASNTFPRPSPADSTAVAGVGGGDLFEAALAAIKHLRAEAIAIDCAVDLLACGGILDGESLQAYRSLGVKAAQYWSALVYRGPLAGAIIESELAQHDYEYEAIHRESLA